MRPRIDWDYHWPRLLAHVKMAGEQKIIVKRLE